MSLNIRLTCGPGREFRPCPESLNKSNDLAMTGRTRSSAHCHRGGLVPPTVRHDRPPAAQRAVRRGPRRSAAGPRAERRRRRHRQFRRCASRPPRRDRGGAGARAGARPAGGGAHLRAASAQFLPTGRAAVPAHGRARQAAPAGRDRTERGHGAALRRGAGAPVGGGFRRRAFWSRGSPSPASRSASTSISASIARARPPISRRRAPSSASPSMSCRGSRTKGGRSAPARSAPRSPPAGSTEATELLGYPWFVSAEVVHGDKRGRELGYPTANLRLDPGCGLKHGIYAVRVGRGRAPL